MIIYSNETKRKHNANWPLIPDHSYRMLIIRGFGSENKN